MTRRAEALAARLREGVPTAAPAVAELVALLEALGEDAFDPDVTEPGHVTASGFVVFAGSVLLVRHGSLGRWMQPGGHVEPGDPDTEAAARREVAEETGVTALEPLGLLDVDVHPIPAGRGRPAHLHFDVRWAFRASDDRLATTVETVAVAWVPVRWAAKIDESVARPIRAMVAGSLVGPSAEVNP